MDISQLLARIIGPYMLIAGLGILVRRDLYQKRLAELPGQTFLLMVSGAFTLLLGLLLVQVHNIWTPDWRILITLVCWITLLKGATALLAPDLMGQLARWYDRGSTRLPVQAAITILFGLYTSFKGYA